MQVLVRPLAGAAAKLADGRAGNQGSHPVTIQSPENLVQRTLGFGKAAGTNRTQ